jgi:hypothetical protein
LVVGLLGLLDGLLLEPDDPVDPELEPVLPELDPLLPLPIEPELLPEPVVPPEPLVLPELLPYCFTQSSRSVPILPTHWLGTADVSLLELPVEPLVLGLLLEPEPDPIEPLEPELLEPAPLAPEPLEPVALGVLDEPPLLLPALPELCAHDAVARPSMAAATAAVSVLAFTI